ncbi:hypothetical protein ESY86_20405 [Subsaximicrobium wynnwilliamsii]|uniref:Uncharacterized protein n=1 Tax=Subsaximicrobium wynnwilliamsii TaxID=291179 RepID=A0A5C6ZA85_9FLAO|nr:hypothetical protein [Subsaximicrobium wynnwilliamsii]TXD81434.1 hypothetical protein ESY87_17965 [Subsaximicrobium wynnwilliamsii]TXD86298.1 hypothetical protein ESY86_20405 [Subsaximicrobium wynnwilliamsii]TXE00789.1 hypothetical protein ESY88_18215 [Subsaximicrobium wynnwilliamsii]
MKRIVFLFMMSLTFSAFSSNSISEIKVDCNSITNKIDYNFTEIDNNSYTFNEDFGWGVTCYVIIQNQVTGEERKVSGSGTGATPGLALQDCGKNARKNAKELYNIVP